MVLRYPVNYQYVGNDGAYLNLCADERPASARYAATSSICLKYGAEFAFQCEMARPDGASQGL